MDLLIQFGYGMMNLCKDFLKQWGTFKVILSPRDLDPDQLINFSDSFTKKGGEVLVDPQFYLPRSNHQRLLSHAYWPSPFDTEDFMDSGIDNMVAGIIELNDNINSRDIIVPGERAIDINEEWLTSQKMLYEKSQQLTKKPLFLTLCLSSDVVRNNEQCSGIIDLVDELNPFGVYLILEHPSDSYIVEDPIWLSNALDISAGLILMGKKVIVGYSNQQQLMMAVAGVQNFATGNWKNVRSFSIDKFRVTDDEPEITRAKWYYIPQSFSEFTLPFLDVSLRLGIEKARLIPNPNSPVGNIPIDAPQPTLSAWSERFSFIHFLDVIRKQGRQLSFHSYDETRDFYLGSLNLAEETLRYFHSKGLRGNDRDYLRAIDSSRTAIQFLDHTHGGRLRRNWNSTS